MTKFFRAKIIQRLFLEVVAGETPKNVVDKISQLFVCSLPFAALASVFVFRNKCPQPCSVFFRRFTR